MSIEKYTIGSRTLYITTRNNDITNIEIVAKPSECDEFLQCFALRQGNSKNFDLKNSCSTFIIQRNIAKSYKHYPYLDQKKQEYNWRSILFGLTPEKDQEIAAFMQKLHKASQLFADLEANINQPAATTKLSVIKSHITSLKTDLTQNITDLFSKDSDAIKERLLKNITPLFEKMEALAQENMSFEQIRNFLSAQTLSSDTMSLGEFIARVQWQLLDAAIREIYEIIDSPILQNGLHLHAAIKALSDAKSEIERRSLSLYGARYANTFNPIPKSMIDSIRENESTEEEEQVRLSLMPFLKKPGDVKNVDKMICFFTGQKEVKRGWLTAIGSNALVITANISDLVIAGIRIVWFVPGFLLALACRPSQKLTQIMKAIDKGFSEVAHFISNKLGVTGAKKLRAKCYKCPKAEEEDDDDDRENVLKEIRASSKSQYCMLLDRFSPSKVAAYVGHSLKSFILAIPRAIKEAYENIVDARPHNREQRFKEIHHTHRQKVRDKKAASAKSELGATQNGEEPKPEGYALQKTYQTATPWRANNFSSPIDFVDEIVYGLMDTVITEMFRKSPGRATAFFGMSLASLGTIAAPALAAKIFGAKIANVLYQVPAVLTKNFTGSPIDESLFKKVIGVFLEWKVGFFGTELLTSAAITQDFEYLQELFEDPEGIILGAIVLVSTGWSLQHIPHIKNPSALLINFFSEEARSTSHAQFGLNSVEFAFLGLKFLLMCHAAMTGAHTRPAANAQLIERLKEIADSTAEDKQSQVISAFRELANIDLTTEAAEILLKNIGTKAHVESTTQESENDLTLNDSLDTLLSMQAHGVSFNSDREARAYFNGLHDQIDEHNTTHPNKPINKEHILHNFYNQFCYKGSNTLWRIITGFPLYLGGLTLLWRGLKYAVASPKILHSPSIRYQVKKSFNKDGAIFFQGIALLARTARAITLAVKNVFYGIACFFARIFINKYTAKRKTIITVHTKLASFFAIHRTSLFTRPFRAIYARCAKVADTHSDGLTQELIYAKLAIQSSEPSRAETNTETQASSTTPIPILRSQSTGNIKEMDDKKSRKSLLTTGLLANRGGSGITNLEQAHTLSKSI